MRTFLAVSLAEIFREEIGRFMMKYRTLDRIKWTPQEQVHVTLHFFGETAADELEKIHRCASAFSAKTKPFPLALENTGYFPDFKNPRVLWTGILDLEGGLQKLQKELEGGLSAEGFACETRPYRPHGTLGRPKPGFKAEVLEFPKTELRQILHLHLYRSVPGPGGPRYEILQTYPFSQTD